jgi:NAD(P)-dependent dehydrogenase (short-subunit alcohol dehydrogenase family)
MVAPLAGKVAWVAGVGEGTGELAVGVGRAAALLLSARGARVLVTGATEKTLGACVGEIAHGGGAARHLVSALRTTDEARACVASAVERFGGLDVAVVVTGGELEGAARAFDAAKAAMPRGGRLILVAPGRDPRIADFVQEVARAFAARGLACNAVATGSAAKLTRDAEPEDVAELIALLCGRAGDVVTGATLPVA